MTEEIRELVDTVKMAIRSLGRHDYCRCGTREVCALHEAERVIRKYDDEWRVRMSLGWKTEERLRKHCESAHGGVEDPECRACEEMRRKI